MYPLNNSLSRFNRCTNFLGEMTPVFFLAVLICGQNVNARVAT